jgi:hypothetical protein
MSGRESLQEVRKWPYWLIMDAYEVILVERRHQRKKDAQIRKAQQEAQNRR